MKTSHQILVTAILVTFCATSAFSVENIGRGNRKANPRERFASGYARSAYIIHMEFNNGRSTMMNRDMWGDAVINGNARHEMPHLFNTPHEYSGTIWKAGEDASGNLKFGTPSNRQSGINFLQRFRDN